MNEDSGVLRPNNAQHDDTTEVAETRERGLLACGLAWCIAFGGLHVYWALGGRAGLGTQRADADAALASTWFALYNGAVAAACVIAAILAIADLATDWRIVSRMGRIVVTLAVLLAARGILGVGGLAWAAVRGEIDSPPVLIAVEVFFVAGAAILLLLARRGGRRLTPRW